MVFKMTKIPRFIILVTVAFLLALFIYLNIDFLNIDYVRWHLTDNCISGGSTIFWLNQTKLYTSDYVMDNIPGRFTVESCASVEDFIEKLEITRQEILLHLHETDHCCRHVPTPKNLIQQTNWAYWANVSSFKWIHSIVFDCSKFPRIFMDKYGMHITPYVPKMSFDDCVDEENWLISSKMSSNWYTTHSRNRTEVCLGNVKTPFYQLSKKSQCYRHLYHTPTFYVHLIPYGHIDSDGNVLTNGNALIPYQPAPMWNPMTYVTKYVREVFIINQQYGEAVYHTLCDHLPRLAAYLTFLRAHPEIKIAMFKKTSLEIEPLKALGISLDRVITGPLCGDLIYMPQGGGSGNTHLSSALIYKYEIRKGLNINMHDLKRNVIIVVKRSVSRTIDPHLYKQMILNLTELADNYNYEVYEFLDNPSPPFAEMVNKFSRAKVVIAIHGAGLGNIIFSESNTTIIEIMCREFRNLCYKNQSIHSGMFHYGLFAKPSGSDKCLNLVFDLEAVLNVTLKAAQRK